MRWTKVRKLVHDSFADSVCGRVKVDVSNTYPRSTFWGDKCNRGWISMDGEMIAHIDPHYGRRLTLSLPESYEGAQGRRTLLIVDPHESSKVPAGAETGTFMDFPQACWQYLHSSLNDSLRSRDPFVSALAMLNAKVGRTRLQRASAWDLHPLTRAMLDFRLEAERGARTDQDVRRRKPRASNQDDATT